LETVSQPLLSPGGERELDMVRMHAELNGRDYIATPDARMAQV